MTVQCPSYNKLHFAIPMNWLWFLVFGWWLGILWLCLSLLVCLTIIGIPAGAAMALKTPEIMFGET